MDFTLGQVWVDVMLNVDEVPARGRIRRGRSSEALHWRQLSRAAGGQLHGRADRARRHSWATACGRISSASHSRTTASRISARIVLMRDSGFRVVLSSSAPKEDVHRFLWRRGSWRLGHVRHAGAAAQRRGAHQRQHTDGPHGHRRGRIPAQRPVPTRLHATTRW